MDIEYYFQLLKQHPQLGKFSDDSPIKVIVDPEQMKLVEKKAQERLAAKGHCETWGEVGVVFEDQYLLVLRDAVQLPSNKTGTYLRVLEKPLSSNGVAVFPVCDRKLLLLKQHRHPTQKWHWEIPRGFAEENDSEVDSMFRELKEETGAIPVSFKRLGEMYSNTGMGCGFAAIYLAEIDGIGELEEDEGIVDCKLASSEEIDRMICAGELNDSFTLAALALARAQKLFA